MGSVFGIVSRLAGVLLLMLVVPAFGIVVNPGDSFPLSGTTAAANPDLMGTVVFDEFQQFALTFSDGDFLHGRNQARVIESSQTGRMVYMPRLRDIVNLFPDFLEFTVITGIEYSGFVGIDTNVDFRLDGFGDIGPHQVTRSADGNSLFFDYMWISPGVDSYHLSIYTDTYDFDTTGQLTVFGKFDVFSPEVFQFTIEGVPAPIPQAPSCDLNFDNVCSIEDLDELYSRISFASTLARFDLNSDGIVDDNDIDPWLSLASVENGKQYVRGDVDLDGKVAGNDFTILAAKFGDDGFWGSGNFNGEGGDGFLVSGADFTQLAANFGHTSVAAIPEPNTTCVLPAAGLATALLLRRRNRSSRQIAAVRNSWPRSTRPEA